MKLFIYLYILLVILFTPFIVADDVDIVASRLNYSKGETFQAELFIKYPLENKLDVSHLSFKQDDKIISVPYFFYNMGGRLFVYFTIPNIENGTYKFQVKDVVYVKEGILVKKDFSVDIPIVDGNDSLSIDVGFVDGTKKGVKEILFRNNGNFDLNVSIISEDVIKKDKNKFLIPANGQYTFQFLVDMSNKKENQTFTYIYFDYLNKTYKIPVYLGESFIIIQNGSIALLESNNFINLTLDYGQKREGPIRLKSYYSTTLNDLRFELTGNLNKVVNINVKNLQSFQSGEIIEQSLIINNNKNISGEFSGDLILTNQDKVIFDLPIYINIKEKEEPFNNETIINNMTNDTIENISIPPIEDDEKSSNALIVIIIVIVLLIFGFFYYFRNKGKFKKGKPEFTFQN